MYKLQFLVLTLVRITALLARYIYTHGVPPLLWTASVTSQRSIETAKDIIIHTILHYSSNFYLINNDTNTNDNILSVFFAGSSRVSDLGRHSTVVECY